MRMNRPSGAAPDHAPTQDATRPRGHRAGAGLVRLLSATTVITATCALFALPASAATASAHIARLHTTTTTVSASPARAFTHAPVKLSATVRSRVGTPTGTVVFTWNRTKLCTATLHHGSGSCTVRFNKARTYVVVGTYARNSRYFGSSGTVRVRIVNPPPPPPVKTTTTVTATPSSGYVGAAVQLSATVKSSGSTPTGTVTFTSGSKTLCAAHLSAGSASCASTFGAAGTSTVTGTYGGDAGHLGSSGNTSLTSKVATTTTTITNKGPGIIQVGGTYTFNVTVASPAGAPAATGTVNLAPDTPPTAPGYTCTATLSNGKGSCTIKPSEYGIDNFTATYTGDAGHSGSASDGKFPLQVQNVTTTKVAAPSAAVGNVMLNALVYAMGANITMAQGGKGSVTFYLSTTPGPAGTAISGCAGLPLITFTGGPSFDNVAACTGNTTLNGLTAGTYYITVVYTGDLTNVGSTSPQFTLKLS